MTNIITLIESLKNNDTNDLKVIQDIIKEITLDPILNEGYNDTSFVKKDNYNDKLNYCIKRAIMGSTSSTKNIQKRFLLLLKVLLKYFISDLDFNNIFNFVLSETDPKLASNKTHLKYLLFFKTQFYNFMIVDIKDNTINSKVHESFINFLIKYDEAVYITAGFIYNNLNKIISNDNSDDIIGLYYSVFNKLKKEKVTYYFYSYLLSLNILLNNCSNIKKYDFEKINKYVNNLITPKYLYSITEPLIKNENITEDKNPFFKLLFKYLWANIKTYSKQLFSFFEYFLNKIENEKILKKNKCIILLTIMKYIFHEFTDFKILLILLTDSSNYVILKKLFIFYNKQNFAKNSDIKSYLTAFENNLIFYCKGNLEICKIIYEIIEDINENDKIIFNKSIINKFIISNICKDEQYLDNILQKIKNNMNNNYNYINLKKELNKIDTIFSSINNIENYNIKLSTMKYLINANNNYLDNIDKFVSDLNDVSKDKLRNKIINSIYDSLLIIIQKDGDIKLYNKSLTLIKNAFIDKENDKKSELFDKVFELINRKITSKLSEISLFKQLFFTFIIDKKFIINDEINDEFYTTIEDLMLFYNKLELDTIDDNDKIIYFDSLLYLLNISTKQQRELINKIIKNFIQLITQESVEILIDEITKQDNIKIAEMLNEEEPSSDYEDDS